MHALHISFRDKLLYHICCKSNAVVFNFLVIVLRGDGILIDVRESLKLSIHVVALGKPEAPVELSSHIILSVFGMKHSFVRA